MPFSVLHSEYLNLGQKKNTWPEFLPPTSTTGNLKNYFCTFLVDLHEFVCVYVRTKLTGPLTFSLFQSKEAYERDFRFFSLFPPKCLVFICLKKKKMQILWSEILHLSWQVFEVNQWFRFGWVFFTPAGILEKKVEEKNSQWEQQLCPEYFNLESFFCFSILL